jgi:fatty acyl-CoA reductase
LICSTYKEPIIGWVNNLYGPIGITVGTALGVLRVVHAGGDINMEMVPVDYSSNALLASVVEIAAENITVPKVYNFATHPANKTNYKIYMEHCMNRGNSFPTNKSIWYHTLKLEPSSFKYEFYKILYHVIPALFLDSFRLAVGKKPK